MEKSVVAKINALAGAILPDESSFYTNLEVSMRLFPLIFATGTGAEVQRPMATVVVGWPGDIHHFDAGGAAVRI